MIIDKRLYLSKKIAIVIFIFGLIFWSGCVSKNEKVIGEENIGGIYNAKIVTLEIPIPKSLREVYRKDTSEIKEIHYLIGDKQFKGYYLYQKPYPDSLDWIKQNTKNNSVFLNWYNYGHTIRGTTGRDVIIANPSENLWDNIGISYRMDKQRYEKEYGGFETPEKVKDVALALTTNDIAITNQIMDKYDAKYIYVTLYDLDMFPLIVMGRGDSSIYSDYSTTVEISGTQQTVHNQNFFNSTLGKLLIFKGKDLNNYHLVYESEPDPYSSHGNEQRDKAIYNMLYGGNLTVQNTGYIKIFEYIKEAN